MVDFQSRQDLLQQLRPRPGNVFSGANQAFSNDAKSNVSAESVKGNVLGGSITTTEQQKLAEFFNNNSNDLKAWNSISNEKVMDIKRELGAILGLNAESIKLRPKMGTDGVWTINITESATGSSVGNISASGPSEEAPAIRAVEPALRESGHSYTSPAVVRRPKKKKG